MSIAESRMLWRTSRVQYKIQNIWVKLGLTRGFWGVWGSIALTLSSSLILCQCWKPKNTGFIREGTQCLSKHAQSYLPACGGRSQVFVGFMAWVLGGSVEKQSGREMSGWGNGPRTPTMTPSQMPFMPTSGVCGEPCPIPHCRKPNPYFKDPSAEGRGYNSFLNPRPLCRVQKSHFPKSAIARLQGPLWSDEVGWL